MRLSAPMSRRGRPGTQAGHMQQSLAPSKVLRFGEFEAELEARCLYRRGAKVRLREQVFELLTVLLERAGEVVTREELQRRLWPGDTLVDVEINLNTAVARLREALGDSVKQPRYIETLPKRGYRLLVNASAAESLAPAARRGVRLVVLPLANVSGEESEEYFSDAMTDDVITALCQVAPEQLAVIARTTAMHYRHTSKDVARIARELSVDYAVEGGVRRGDGRVAINVQLIDASDQTHLFAERYQGGMSELFGLQTRIAEDIAAHIPSLSLVDGDGRARRMPTGDLQAYELYLLGRYTLHRGRPEDFNKAKACLEEAVARDPGFALPYDAIAEICYWTGFFGYLPPRQALGAGLWAALRAVEIDPALGESRGALGLFRGALEHDWVEAERELAAAVELAPSSPLVRFRYTLGLLIPRGRAVEAAAEFERALEFDPLNAGMHLWLGIYLWMARDYKRALQETEFCEEIDAGNYLNAMMTGVILRESGRLEEAIAPQRRAVELSGGTPHTLGWLGLALAQSGETAEARAVLRRLQAIRERAYVLPTSVAWVHVGLGELDEAFAWMERAIEERDPNIPGVQSFPFLDPLRGDPRYLALLRRMNLEP